MRCGIALLFLFPAVSGCADEMQTPVGLELYRTHCGGCHGASLEGASATTLVKTDWQYGRDSFSVSSNISHGIVGTNMPAFRNILDESQIEALVQFLYESQTSPPDAARPFPDEIKTELYTLRAETLVAGGISPWSIGFIDDATALVSDNGGDLYWLRDGELDPNPVTGIPPVDQATSTGGLMGLAIDPDYTDNGWVYLAISHSEDPQDRYAAGLTQVIRGRVRDYEWQDTEYLFRLGAEYHLPDSKHWGGRLLFDEEGLLYFSIGDMSVPMDSQDVSKPAGKVFRMHADGSIPEDNPFVDVPGALTAIFSIGNRNVQGIAQHPESGEVWASEHGPRGGDELNRLLPGRNYGWPVVTFGINYDGTIISEQTHADGIVAPVAHWTPSPAVSQIAFATGDAFHKWAGDLLLASLSFEELRRLTLENNMVVDEELLFKGYGRIRDIQNGLDGALYILLNNPGSIVKLTAVVEE